jgi:hypothetical protein
MSADPNRYKLTAAKELMQSDQYDAARAVLETIPFDQTAQQWLRWMDDNQPKGKRKSKSQGKGLSWGRVIPFVFACSLCSFIAGFGAARNPSSTPVQVTQTRVAAASTVNATASPLPPTDEPTVRPTDAPTSTLTDEEWVEFGFATSEARGLPLRAIFEELDGVTNVETVYVTFWSSDHVTVESRLDAPQSIVDQLLSEAQSFVPDMTEILLTVTSPDERTIYYVWETVNPFWRPLDMSNGELLATRAPTP